MSLAPLDLKLGIRLVLPLSTLNLTLTLNSDQQQYTPLSISPI